jgi:uncharacterized protein YciI
MKFAVTIEYNGDAEKVKATHAAHREYLRRFLENGQLRAAGPFKDAAGCFWVMEAENETTVETIVKADPFFQAGIILGWKLYPLAYWSAQAAKGET